MATKVPLYCMDSCVYVDWLSGDKKAPLQEIEEVIIEVEKREANLLAPVLVYIEVMSAKNPAASMTKFRDFLKRSNVIPVDITLAIAEKAEVVRSAAFKLKPVKKIKPQDAMFLAASMIHKADVLLTRDADMLTLDGHSIVQRLKITKPKPLSGKVSLPGTT